MAISILTLLIFLFRGDIPRSPSYGVYISQLFSCRSSFCASVVYCDICFVIISPYFGISEKLWFVIAAFPWYLHSYFCSLQKAVDFINSEKLYQNVIVDTSD